MPATKILVLDRDDALHAGLAKAAPRLESQMVACHQTAAASKELATGRVGVLVAGPSTLTSGGVRFLQQAHEARPELIIMLVTAKDGPEVGMRDLVRIGASDLIRFPSAAASLRTALERAVEMTGNGTMAAEANAGGRVLTITSPTGGCGKTFFATNLAWELAAKSGKRVALLDFDLQFGEVSTAMRLRPTHTVTDLVAAGNDSASIRSQLRDFTVHHSSGLEVLAAPEDPAEADGITSPDVTNIIQAAKELYHYVIVDTPAALTEQVLASFDLSERLVVMATLDLPSIKNLGTFLSTLERLHIPADGVSLVMNKAESDVGLTTGEVQRLFRQGFQGILPYSKEVSRSVNSGRPVLESARQSDVGRALAATMAAVLPDEPCLTAQAAAAAPVAAPTARRMPLLARLLGRPA